MNFIGWQDVGFLVFGMEEDGIRGVFGVGDQLLDIVVIQVRADEGLEEDSDIKIGRGS